LGRGKYSSIAAQEPTQARATGKADESFIVADLEREVWRRVMRLQMYVLLRGREAAKVGDSKLLTR